MNGQTVIYDAKGFDEARKEQKLAESRPMRRRSPIDMLIDSACGITDESPPLRAPNDEEKEAARNVASHVIQHIDDMYPEMWDGVPKTARVSVRNTIYNRVASLLTQWSNVKITNDQAEVRVIGWDDDRMTSRCQ